jgi:hypothetical protein
MSQTIESTLAFDPTAFLAGGGEVSERTHAFNGSSTPLGPVAKWPQSLKIAVRIMLDSRYAMWLGWGTDFIFLLNDAHARMALGPRHPRAIRAVRRVNRGQKSGTTSALVPIRCSDCAGHHSRRSRAVCSALQRLFVCTQLSQPGRDIAVVGFAGFV